MVGEVALLVSAWIEIRLSWTDWQPQTAVALLVSAWIEIRIGAKVNGLNVRRTPRECVD